MKDLLTRLVPAFGPSGREQEIGALIAELARPYGEIGADPMGNLIVHKPGSGKRVMVAAHMDSLGLAATYIEDGGFVRVGALGGLRLAWLLGRTVRFESGVLGVVCVDEGVKPEDLKITDLYVDPAGQTVELGESAVICGQPMFTGDYVTSPYLDNRIGCAIALRALELVGDTDNDLYFVFTVQEEVGVRGAKPAAYTVDPQMAVAVDVCASGDAPGAEKNNPVKLGAGPVVKFLDRSTICHPSVVEAMLQAGQALEIPCQKYAAAAGGTDAGAIHQSRGGVPTGVLSIATRYIHSGSEICSLTDAEQCARLLAKVVGA